MLVVAKILQQASPTDHSSLREAARRPGSPRIRFTSWKDHAIQHVDNIVFAVAHLTDEMRGSSPCDEEDETVSYHAIALSRKTAALKQHQSRARCGVLSSFIPM